MTNLKKHNFGAGPCILPDTVMQQAADAVINWNNSGLSILEVSHRSPEFETVINQTQQLVRVLLNVPDDYAVLFLQGGASSQFSMVPFNFLKTKGTYINSGFFAIKAINEAKYYGQVDVVATSEDERYTYIPQFNIRELDSDYLHVTSNNTIEGTQMFSFPKVNVPLICDMSSDIFSKTINVRDFDLIYAGAQKNMGPAGMTIVIVKNSLLDQINKNLPAMSDYRVFRDHNSLYNTPPVFSIYVAMLNLMWLKNNGGVSAIEQNNKKKAQLLYQEIDRNTLFSGLASPEHRSRMNVTFKAKSEAVEKEFLKFAETNGIVGIKGYPSVGGFRTSLYNALPYQSVEFLVSIMKEFEAVTIKKKLTSRQLQFV